jgi:hypothetical protein
MIVPGYAERENEPKFSNEKSLEFKQEVNHTEINMLKTEKAPLDPPKDERNITLFERLLFLLPIGKDKEGNYVFYYG